MNCKHELAPWCASCNGTPDLYRQAHVPLDYSEHKYDLLDPETARTVLGEVRIAAPAAPSDNPAPSERLYETAVDSVFHRAYDALYDCEWCVEALRDGMDCWELVITHMDGAHSKPPARTTQYLDAAGRPAWHTRAGAWGS